MEAAVESVHRTPPLWRRTPPQSTAMASVSTVSSVLRMGPLREARSLKISWRPIRPSLPAAAAGASGGRAMRRGSVVCEAPETSVEVPVVTESTWQSLVLKSDRTVLVSFWAPWCGPCRMIHPVVADIAAEYSGKVECFELNTDENPDIATQYGIRSIPTLIFFKGGEKKDAIIGAVPKTTLTATLEKFL